MATLDGIWKEIKTISFFQRGLETLDTKFHHNTQVSKASGVTNRTCTWSYDNLSVYLIALAAFDLAKCQVINKHPS